MSHRQRGSHYRYTATGLEKGGHLLAELGKDAQIPETDIKRELVFIVVGEAARADKFSLNGYANKTNPLLEKETPGFPYQFTR